MVTSTSHRIVNGLCLLSSLAMLLVVQTLVTPLARAASGPLDVRNPFLATLPATGGEASSLVPLLIAWTLLAGVLAVGGLSWMHRRMAVTERIAQITTSHSRLVANNGQRSRSADDPKKEL